MASRRRRLKTALVTARSELRKGFAMPSEKKIKTVLRTRSKEFIMRCFFFAFRKLSKTEKISLLIKIQSGKISRGIKKRRKTRARRSKTRRSKTRRKSKTRRRSSKGRPKKGSKEAKRKMAKVRAARRR